jgi:hypothetical protein
MRIWHSSLPPHPRKLSIYRNRRHVPQLADMSINSGSPTKRQPIMAFSTPLPVRYVNIYLDICVTISTYVHAPRLVLILVAAFPIYLREARRNGRFYCRLALSSCENAAVPYWLTGQRIDEIEVDHLIKFSKIRREFMDILEEEFRTLRPCFVRA